MKKIPQAACLLALSFLLPACTTVTQTEIRESDSGLEKFNKASYNVTEVADQYILKPIAKGYTNILPDPVEDSFSRAFANLKEVGTASNELLQGELGEAGTATSRVLINSTLGVLGLFEVAEKMGIRKNYPEDFGQTLAVWGVGSGPYIYIPFIGPSCLRDTHHALSITFLTRLIMLGLPETSTYSTLGILSKAGPSCCKEERLSVETAIFS